MKPLRLLPFLWLLFFLPLQLSAASSSRDLPDQCKKKYSGSYSQDSQKWRGMVRQECRCANGKLPGGYPGGISQCEADRFAYVREAYIRALKNQVADFCQSEIDRLDAMVESSINRGDRRDPLEIADDLAAHSGDMCREAKTIYNELFFARREYSSFGPNVWRMLCGASEALLAEGIIARENEDFNRYRSIEKEVVTACRQHFKSKSKAAALSLAKERSKREAAEAAARKKRNEAIKAAEQGSPDAQYALGAKYYDGNGFPKDFKKAAHWFQKAAEQGSMSAQTMLGTMYQEGKGVPKSDKKATHWHLKAAKQGMPRSLAALKLLPISRAGPDSDVDQLYELGVALNNQGQESSAAYYLTKASERGHEDAKKYLESMAAEKSRREEEARRRQQASMPSAELCEQINYALDMQGITGAKKAIHLRMRGCI